MLIVLIISDNDVVCHSYSDLSPGNSKDPPASISSSDRFSLQALKTKHDTPKYGLIYHAQLVGQASSKLKGKVSSFLF